jgi:beta-glucosidase
MATINLGNASPTEGDMRQVDLKQPTIQVQPVTIDTPTLTPATTPEQNSPSEEVMAGKKTFSMERPTDKARDLAAKLTLEEQVRTFFVVCRKSLDHHERQSRGRIMQGVGHFTIVP